VRLRYLFPGWYAIVMGMCGLALAWHRADALLGEGADAAALVLGLLAAGVFAVLAVATVLRGRRHPEAWAEDRRHPVRHTFVAALPIALLLLGTVGVALLGPPPSGAPPSLGAVAAWMAATAWALGALAQAGVTLWVLSRWWHPASAGGLAWPGVTPALLIPIVGNVLVPLAGVPLGQTAWSLAQFGVGLMFWPVVLGLIAARLAVAGPWPDRLRPTAFILVAPPAVVALSLLQLGAPVAVAWALWGMALFTALWVGLQTRRMVELPFGLPHWGASFPLAALTALTLRLATPGTALSVLALALLAATSLIVTALALATVRGLRDGTLLVPEPLPPVVKG
jgi:tellurite resistance protein